jgi:thioesterase domain-containing protein
MHREIPITREMGITVSFCSSSKVVLHAPLHKNLNHTKTAFGGSLNSLAILAGWGLLFILLKGMGKDARVVIQDCSVSYRSPVCRDFEAICELPDRVILDKFLSMLNRKGVARIVLESEIYQDGKSAVSFRGTYVVENA